jgi:hypothetical protein
MQGDKFENKIFKLLIGGSTASNACSMQGDKYEKEYPKNKKIYTIPYFCCKIYK